MIFPIFLKLVDRQEIGVVGDFFSHRFEELMPVDRCNGIGAVTKKPGNGYGNQPRASHLGSPFSLEGLTRKEATILAKSATGSEPVRVKDSGNAQLGLLGPFVGLLPGHAAEA